MKRIRDKALWMLADLADNELDRKTRKQTPKWYQRLYYDKGCIRDRLIEALVDISNGLKGDNRLKHIKMAKLEVQRHLFLEPMHLLGAREVSDYFDSALCRKDIATMYGVDLNLKDYTYYKQSLRGVDNEDWLASLRSDLKGTLVRGVHVPSWLLDQLEPSECVEWFERVKEVWCGK